MSSSKRGARRALALPESARLSRLFAAVTDSLKRLQPTSDGRRRNARARLGGRERCGEQTYLSTGMVKVGCTMAAIVAFRTSAAGSGACQKMASHSPQKRDFRRNFSPKVARYRQMSRWLSFRPIVETIIHLSSKRAAFPRDFTRISTPKERKSRFGFQKVSQPNDLGRLSSSTFRKRMGKQSGARWDGSEGKIKYIGARRRSALTILRRTRDGHTPCVPSVLSPSSRSPSPARTLPPTLVMTPSPRVVRSRLAPSAIARYVTPPSTVLCLSLRRRVGRDAARARASATHRSRSTRSSALVRHGR